MVNAGLIAATDTSSGTGIGLYSGGLIDNVHGGTISGLFGVIIAASGTGGGTAVNDGLITASTGADVVLDDGGLVSNASLGTLTGGSYGIDIVYNTAFGQSGTVINQGSVSGKVPAS